MKVTKVISSDVSTATSLPTGLKVEDQEIIKASSGPKLSELNLSQFKHVLVRPLVITGIKTLPSDEEINLLYNQVLKYYRAVTVSDFYLAFELNALGRDWPRIEHYGLLNLQFIASVVDAYQGRKGKANLELTKVENRERLNQNVTAPEISLEERKAIIKDMLQRDRERYINGKGVNEIYGGVICSYVITKLYELDIVNDNLWSDSTWNAVKIKARTNVNNDYASRRKKVIHEVEKREFKNDLKLEVFRLLYLDILVDKDKYDLIINKL